VWNENWMLKTTMHPDGNLGLEKEAAVAKSE
jgi:hypothetical protein